MKHWLTAFACALVQIPFGVAAIAQQGERVFASDAPAVTYGRYVRLEAGGAISATDSGDWLPPGQSDPQVFFDLDGEDRAMGSAAVGFDWMNGWRGEVALSHFASEDVAGDWSRTEPPTPGPHASVDTAVASTAIMGNVYYLPLQASGRNGKFQPFLTAGLGLSMNHMDDWTRTNPDATQEVREFEGRTNPSLAWSVGAGASWQVTPTGSRPVLLEASYRYYDLGSAQGGATPLEGSGTSEPRQPLTVDTNAHVLAIGVRIPLR